MDEWITLREASEIIGKTPSALRKLIHRGRFTRTKKKPDTAGGSWYVHRDEVDEWTGPGRTPGKTPVHGMPDMGTMSIQTFIEQQKEWQDKADALRDGLNMYRFKFEELDRRIKLLPAPPEAINDKMELQALELEKSKNEMQAMESTLSQARQEAQQVADELQALELATEAEKALLEEQDKARQEELQRLKEELDRERGKGIFCRIREMFTRQM